MAEKAMFPEARFLRAVFGNELPENRLSAVFAPENQKLLKELRQEIRAALGTISYRERGILEMRFGLGDGYAYTLAEAGFVFRLTRERIRQLQGKALRKLKQRADELKDYLKTLRATS